MQSMLKYNDIKERVYIDIDGSPYEVLSSHVSRKQQRKPVNVTKLRNLITKKVVERSFHQNERVNEADIEKRKIKYLYRHKDQLWFCDENNPKNRFRVADTAVGNDFDYVTDNSLVEALYFKDGIIEIKVPLKLDLKVTDAPPNIKGNTAQGGTKLVTLETGATILVPLFIEEGDIVRVNTESGKYSERAK